MVVIHVRELQIHQAAHVFSQLIENMCDLPHAVSNILDELPELLHTLETVLPAHQARQLCDHVMTHVQHYMQYVTYPDAHTLIQWGYMTQKFLHVHEFHSRFCDLWRAHVNLVMLHVQAHANRAWEQEQKCWFNHSHICEQLKAQFEKWLKDTVFAQDMQ